jgi:UDP-N-acetylglucosamine 3-dehydrogenase
MYRFGLIGIGRWGENYLRILSEHHKIELVACCDINQNSDFSKTLKKFKTRFTPNYKDLLKLNVDAVVVSTDPESHFEIASFFLENRVHVLCEKPLCLSSNNVATLSNLSKLNDSVLITGHTFLFNDSIKLIENKLLGLGKENIRFIRCFRGNPGPVRENINVIYDLAPHDISIALFLLKTPPIYVSAKAINLKEKDGFDWSQIHLYFEKTEVSIEIFWAHPLKERKISIYTETKLFQFDDVSSQKVSLFEYEIKNEPVFLEKDIEPYKTCEPLLNNVNYFLQLIEKKQTKQFISDPNFSFIVIKIIECAIKSIQNSNSKIEFNA